MKRPMWFESHHVRASAFRGALVFTACCALLTCTPPNFDDDPAVPVDTGEPLTIAPVAPQLAAGSQVVFQGSGGTTPYEYSIASGSGTIDPSTGIYLAPAAPETGVVRVTDAADQTADTFVIVKPGPLVLTPANVSSVLVNEHLQFHATGGETPYVYEVFTGVGGITPTGDYSSTVAGANVVVKVTDKNGTGNERTAIIGEVKDPPTPPLTISPSTLTVETGSVYEFAINGGKPPYDYEVTQGTANPMSGSGNPFTVTFTTAGTVKITAADSSTPTQKTDVATITVLPPPLVIIPDTLTINAGSDWTFSASGGTGGYTYSIIPSGAGIVDGNTITFTTTGTRTVRVTDAAAAHANATVTVNAPPAALNINPPTITLTRGGTAQFSASGGSESGYQFWPDTGVGTISSGGLYSATTEGLARIRLTDDAANEAFADITVNPPPLQLDTTSITIEVGGSHQFVASGGTPTYTWAVSSGVGTIGSGGLYSSSVPGSATILVTDSSAYPPEHLSVSASVTVNPTPLTINPTDASIMTGTVLTFTASGGTVGTGYVFSKLSGPGSINASTGQYSSSTTGTATIQVRDATMPTPLTATTTITVTPTPLQITPSAANLAYNAGQDFDATGGVAPYAFSIVSGGGAINGSTGLFTAPAAAGTTIVKVEDASTPTSQTSQATITIYPPLTITPKPATVVVTESRAFTASGGIPPYVFSKLSGVGSITSGGAYTAPDAPGTAVVRVTDSLGNADQANVDVVNAWNTPIIVDSTGMPGQHASLALDATGKPSIAYYGASPKSLKFSSWNGSWSVATVTTTDEPGQYASLALDADGKPRISYYIAKGTKKDLGYAEKNGSWSTTRDVDTSGDVGKYSSLALDPSDSYRPRIAYYDASNDRLKYSLWWSGHWVSMTVDGDHDVGQYASLALDPSDSNYPRIAYYDATNGDLKYAAWTGSTWEIDVVDDNGTVGQHASLALDPSDSYRPRIAYYDATNGYLKYASWNGSTWIPTVVDSSSDVGQYASLALDGTGKPRIAYYDATNGDLKYTAWTGSTWKIDVVDSAGTVGQYCSLAIDLATGTSKIAYYEFVDSSHGKLKFTDQR